MYFHICHTTFPFIRKYVFRLLFCLARNLADTDLMKLNPDEVSDARWMAFSDFNYMKCSPKDHISTSKTSDSDFCRSSITPWLRGLLARGLLQKLFSWAEASCGNHLQERFLTEDQSWDRTKIIHLSSEDVQ